MEKRISKTFKQFMFDLEPDVRAGVYSQIINHCHVTPTCINMWARGAMAYQVHQQSCKEIWLRHQV